MLINESNPYLYTNNSYDSMIILYRETDRCTWSKSFSGVERTMREVSKPSPARKPAHSSATSGTYNVVRTSTQATHYEAAAAAAAVWSF